MKTIHSITDLRIIAMQMAIDFKIGYDKAASLDDVFKYIFDTITRDLDKEQESNS